MKKIIFLIIFFCIGCSPLEISRLLGVGTKPFREQGKVYTKVINKKHLDSYNQVVIFLSSLKASVYRTNKEKSFIVAVNFNASFKQSTNATEVAMFFTPIDENKTQIEVSSLNHFLADFVSTKLFTEIDAK